MKGSEIIKNILTVQQELGSVFEMKRILSNEIFKRHTKILSIENRLKEKKKRMQDVERKEHQAIVELHELKGKKDALLLFLSEYQVNGRLDLKNGNVYTGKYYLVEGKYYNTSLQELSVMINKEHQLQIACVRWFRLQFPSFADMLWHTNNYARDRRAGQVMKAMGVVAGTPDLMLYYSGKLYAFELKTTDGRQSKTQKEWQAEFERQGGTYNVIRSVDEFINQVKEVICN